MNDDPEISGDDYFGLFPEDPAVASDAETGLEKPAWKPSPPKNRLPDPVLSPPPPLPEPELASALEPPAKKPFVAKNKAVPDAPALDPAPTPIKKKPPSEAGKTQIPKKKSAAKPQARKSPPQLTQQAAKKQSPAAPKPAARPPTTAARAKAPWLVILLALTWLALGALGYFVWRHHETLATGTGNRNAQEKIAQLELAATELESRIEELEGRRELQRWGNEAIADGHRAAIYKLDDYFNNPKIQALKEAAQAEIIRVESYFVTTRRFRGFGDEMPFISESDPVGSLTQILLDENRRWIVRANAANMLGERSRDPKAATALAEASHTDPSLYVVQEAILAFAKVTGFRSNGVFDSASVVKWWEKNRAEFD